MSNSTSVSLIRKIYIARLVGRCIVLLITLYYRIFAPEVFNITVGWQFFKGLSIAHLLWVIWVVDMLAQLFPIQKHISIGSAKLFASRFKPIREKINRQALKNYMVFTAKGAYKVFLLWTAFIALIVYLYFKGVLTRGDMFVITVIFYVCDLICVVVWCPFRLIMRNKCCTTCRIFNWDHLMMFSPFIFVVSFYTTSLAVLAVLVWCAWELCILMHPERFWEQTNTALRCSECTDKLCTQYCQKLRK